MDASFRPDIDTSILLGVGMASPPDGWMVRWLDVWTAKRLNLFFPLVPLPRLESSRQNRKRLFRNDGDIIT